MVLVDTSVWVDYFRKGQVKLESLLMEGKVLSHPDIVGELACGNLENRKAVLTILQDLPQTPVVSALELLYFLEEHRIFGKGIGWTDAQLLASAKLAGVALWTLDRKLKNVAAKLGLGENPILTGI